MLRINLHRARRLILAAGCCLLSSAGFATTYYVDGWLGNNGYDGLAATALSSNHGPMRNISQAIIAASDGDTIVAAPGCYQETLWEAGSKSVTLTGPGTVIITGSDPVTTCSAGDGLPDAWVAAQGLNPFDPGVVSLASSLPWANGTNNLAAYQLSQIPPTITATITPAPNAAGWNNTNVVVHFSASSAGSGIAWVTLDTPVTGTTNNCEVTGYAMDNAGNLVSAGVLVNIDRTPPVIALDPGNGQILDQSHPLLLISYSDSGSGTGVPSVAVASGLDLSTLQITLDSIDVTTNFFVFPAEAVGDGSNLAAGTHTWCVSLTDVAGNVVSNAGTLSATGATNPNAPTLSNLNFVDSVTVMPDVPQIWMQGQVSDTNATVSASVNGGVPIPMNKRGNGFGYLLPVEFGTNLIVLVASDAGGQNHSSQVLLVERGNHYRAAITSPEFGAFAEGQAQVVTGYVSAKKDEGWDTEEPLESVSVNGVAATLDWEHMDANGNVPFTTAPDTVPVPADGSPLALTLQIVWPSINNVPLWYLDGYQIVSITLTSSWRAVSAGPFGVLNCDPTCSGQWRGGADRWDRISSYSIDPGPGPVATNLSLDYGYWANCVATYDLESGDWGTPGTNITFWMAAWALGTYRVDGTITDDTCAWAPRELYKDDCTIVFRSRFDYPPNTPVLFTLEGVSYRTAQGVSANLTNVTFQGKSPVSWSNEIGAVSYWIKITSNATYELSAKTLDWPGYSSTTNWDAFYSYFFQDHPSATGDVTCSGHYLSFTGFQNVLPKVVFQARAGKINDGFDPTGSNAWTSVCTTCMNAIVEMVITPVIAADQVELVVLTNAPLVSVSQTDGFSAMTNTFSITGGTTTGKTAVVARWKVTHEEISRLNVMVLQPRTVNISIARIVDNASTNTGPVNAPDDDAIIQWLNEVYKQACLTFVNASVPANQTINIRYDDGSQSPQAMQPPNDAHAGDGRMQMGERQTIETNRTWSGGIHLFFILNSGFHYDHPLACTNLFVRGATPIPFFAFTTNGPSSYVFTHECAASGQDATYTSAHEVGHGLGLSTRQLGNSHDPGPFPNTVQQGLMRDAGPDASCTLRNVTSPWLWHGDWEKANTTAGGL